MSTPELTLSGTLDATANVLGIKKNVLTGLLLRPVLPYILEEILHSKDGIVEVCRMNPLSATFSVTFRRGNTVLVLRWSDDDAWIKHVSDGVCHEWPNSTTKMSEQARYIIDDVSLNKLKHVVDTWKAQKALGRDAKAVIESHDGATIKMVF